MITSYIKAEALSCDGVLSLRIYDGKGGERIYRDITRDIQSLNRFVRTINRGNVSPIHIDELVEDFLG